MGFEKKVTPKWEAKVEHGKRKKRRWMECVCVCVCVCVCLFTVEPLISEADVDGQEGRCQDYSHASDDGQSREDGNTDARRLNNLNGSILWRLFIHPGDFLFVEMERVGRVVVLGHGLFALADDLLDCQSAHAFIVFEVHSTLRVTKQSVNDIRAISG